MFDIGKWFDNWERPLDFTVGKTIVYSMKFSFGEKSLKEWFDKEVEYHKFVGIDYPEETSNCAKKSIIDNYIESKWDYLLKMAVSCLGEKKCLELLKLWWGNKK